MMSESSVSTKIVTLQKVEDGRGGYSMNMRLVTKSRGSAAVGSTAVGYGNGNTVSAEDKKASTAKSKALARIRDYAHRMGSAGEDTWIYTFTYAEPCHSPKVAVKDLRAVCLVGDRIGAKVFGAWELHSDSREGTLGHGLHLHVVSNQPLGSGVWSKGRMSEKQVSYNAVKAEKYLGKQWKEKGSHSVLWRGQVKEISGLAEYRKLWKNVPQCICNKTLATSAVVEEKRKVTQGELFTVVLEDLKCVPASQLGTVNYLERASRLSVRRSKNGTLFASNNCDQPSGLVKWLLSNRRGVILRIYKEAHCQLLSARGDNAVRNYIEL